mgnify:CR=1 FL=1
MYNTQNNYKQLGEYNMNDKTKDLLRQAYEALQFSMEDHECEGSECTDCDLLLNLESELGAVPPYVMALANSIGYAGVHRAPGFPTRAGRYDFLGGEVGCPAVFHVLSDRMQIAFDTCDGEDSLSVQTLCKAGIRLRGAVLRSRSRLQNECGGAGRVTVYAHEGCVYVEVSNV